MPDRRTFRVFIDIRLCKGTEGCGICVAQCPAGVLEPAAELSARGVHPAEVAHPERCTGCDRCMLLCPDLAVVVEHRDEEQRRKKEADHG